MDTFVDWRISIFQSIVQLKSFIWIRFNVLYPNRNSITVSLSTSMLRNPTTENTTLDICLVLREGSQWSRKQIRNLRQHKVKMFTGMLEMLSTYLPDGSTLLSVRHSSSWFLNTDSLHMLLFESEGFTSGNGRAIQTPFNPSSGKHIN